jgi:hypothetical protein
VPPRGRHGLNSGLNIHKLAHKLDGQGKRLFRRLAYINEKATALKQHERLIYWLENQMSLKLTNVSPLGLIRFSQSQKTWTQGFTAIYGAEARRLS